MSSQSNDEQIAWFNSSHFVVEKIIKQGQIQKQEGEKKAKRKKNQKFLILQKKMRTHEKLMKHKQNQDSRAIYITSKEQVRST